MSEPIPLHIIFELIAVVALRITALKVSEIWNRREDRRHSPRGIEKLGEDLSVLYVKRHKHTPKFYDQKKPA